MPSPFPGLDPYLEKNPFFHELHTQMLTEAQALLQPQLRPKYVARLERHLSEGSVWDMASEFISLAGKEPDLTMAVARPEAEPGSVALLPTPAASVTQELEADELELRRQRRMVIYVRTQPRRAVASIELLSPSNKAAGTIGQTRYLEKRASALHGGHTGLRSTCCAAASARRCPSPCLIPPITWPTSRRPRRRAGSTSLTHGACASRCRRCPFPYLARIRFCSTRAPAFERLMIA